MISVMGSIAYVCQARIRMREDTDEREGKKWCRWEATSAKCRANAGFSATYSPWTKRQDVKLIGVPRLPRHLDLIDYRWGLRLQRNPTSSSEELRTGCWANVLQLMQRSDGMGPTCLTTGAMFYSYEHDCLLDGEDFLRLQGAPLNSGGNVSSTQLRIMGGEAFHSGSIAAVVYSLYLSKDAPWYSSGFRTRSSKHQSPSTRQRARLASD